MSVNNNLYRKFETVICGCDKRVTLASCVDGHQDEEWNRNLEIYKRKGFKVELLDNHPNFTEDKCECTNSKFSVSLREYCLVMSRLVDAGEKLEPVGMERAIDKYALEFGIYIQDYFDQYNEDGDKWMDSNGKEYTMEQIYNEFVKEKEKS